MSVVTGVMLICSLVDEEAVGLVQLWLAEHFEGLQLKEVSGGAGGGKSPQFEAWAGGFNYMVRVEDQFVDYVLSTGWYLPENVVLILQPEEGITRIFRPPYSQPSWGND